ncbi:MAG TPA: deoxyribodipyrimidine photo-lyase [Flavobacteriales bacterium]|nr:deoxyribodipyrimidine photo-lyase [Flavobacteriales bacterium]HMR26959.1 deoxyribodipyrimidine photo-lyase [Flavobacteriales bacterium]
MTSTRRAVTIHWFRRDLRLEDNHGLFRALSEHGEVLPLFIFDTDILDRLENRHDRRVDFIHRALSGLQEHLVNRGSTLLVEHGRPTEVWKRLLERYEVKAVTANHDHEPYANARDKAVNDLLAARGIAFRTFKDISIFERSEVVKDDGGPYTVFTPYMRKWRSLFRPEHAEAFPSGKLVDAFHRTEPLPLPSIEQIGFGPTDLRIPPTSVSDDLLRHYERTRDVPAIDGTSRMSVHLRFGTVSVRELVRRSFATSPKYLNELIWREFYMQVLWHHPHAVERAIKPGYDRIAWRRDEQDLRTWSEGRTGYPLVDAGMRELNATGLMHNRVRMVVASFLTKHLLLDWRWGEAYFAARLLDFELSSNNGGWQWASGSGCDAAPYFRVFNPALQQQKFDPQLKYVKRWVPEAGSANYVQPMVVHEVARNRALKAYAEALRDGPRRTEARPQLFN